MNAVDWEIKVLPVHVVVEENKWETLSSSFIFDSFWFRNNPFYAIRANLDVISQKKQFLSFHNLFLLSMSQL